MDPNLTRWALRTITVELFDFVGLDATGFVDLLTELAFGTTLASDVNYAVVAVTDDGELVIEVCAYLSDNEDEEN